MSDQAVREHVLYLLKDGGAHIGFEQAIADLPEEFRGEKINRFRTRRGVCWSTCEFANGTFWNSLVIQIMSHRNSRMATGPRVMHHQNLTRGTGVPKHFGMTCRRCAIS